MITVRRQIQGENVATTEVTAPTFGSERVIYVPAELLATLSEHVARTGVDPSDLLVIGQDGTPLNRGSAGHQWRQVRRGAGMGPFTLHDLRHFYASGLIASGCDMVTVQRALGHSSATITLGVCSHLWPTAEDRGVPVDWRTATSHWLRRRASSAVVVVSVPGLLRTLAIDGTAS